MAFQLITAIVNLFLLVLKTVAYVLVKKSFLLMMVIDNLADMTFSLILCIPNSRFYNKEVSKKICCRLMQLSQFVPVLMFVSDLQRIPAAEHRSFVPYLISILILATQLLAKALLYSCFKNKNFEKQSSDYLLLQDQIYDLFCTLPGILSLLLILSFRSDKEVIIDYVTTVALFALTISFWEKTLIKVKQPKFESLHASLSKIVSNRKGRNDFVISPSNKGGEAGAPSGREEAKSNEVVFTETTRTPSPRFEKMDNVGGVNDTVEMV